MSHPKLLIATTNPGKLMELRSFLADLPLHIVSLSDVNITEEVEEDRKTYQENSIKKATFYAKKSGLPTIADDGGIEIDALDGAPGVRSRRFFAPWSQEATDQKIINAMKNLIRELPKSKRGAKFKTVVTLAFPNGKSFSAVGEIVGELRKPYLKLLKGYPYRSFFYLPKIQKYYHESELTKNQEKLYNHRYKAIQKLKPKIRKMLYL